MSSYILVRASRSGTNIGVVQVADVIQVYSGCHGVPLSMGSSFRKCRDCGAILAFTDLSNKFYLANSGIPQEEELQAWVQVWTGISDIDVHIEY